MANIVYKGYLEQAYLISPYLAEATEHGIRSQVTLVATDNHHVRSQIELLEPGSHSVLSEIGRGSVFHRRCEDSGYLARAYLTTSYLSDEICAALRSQVQRVSSHVIHQQINFVLYNTTNLRILCEFPSRGTTGLNWSATSTMSGDFSVNNLNTDIVEQVWRSNSVTAANLTCDTQIVQGVFLDTLAILNHNLTTSAGVTLQGANNPGFAPVGTTITLTSREDNIFYIAPTLPMTAYRYWRFILSDPTNSDGFLQIGTIVFGASQIFQGECFVDEVLRSTKHFSDKVPTEGFTNVSNDRAIKYATALEFRYLRYQKNNYNTLRGIFDFARTSYKCLWIPTPEFPERFAVFGKLGTIPSERHNVKSEDLDYVSLSLEVDESL